ncbi:MAG TPA: hypothetical protein DCF87_03920 [Opitutae bacterium]|nr:hypothetical protein [Opitutae bacterium]
MKSAFLLFPLVFFSAQANVFTVTKSLPVDLQNASNVFTKSVEVFGLRVLATDSVPDAKVLHTANVLAEYLDNDENGTVDQSEVLAKLLGNSNSEIATMVLFESESEQESFSGSFETLMQILTRSQNLFADEIFENGSSGNDRDATLEEVLHLVTDLGWDEAFPDIWGERKGSSVANAMDLARGGYFENVPAQYPESAWYTYDDETSDYPTQITEYVYWATTTHLGAQNWQGRNHSNYNNEWTPYTKEMLAQTDPAIVSLMTSDDYRFPVMKLPDGNYSVSANNGNASSILPASTHLGSSNWYESSWLGVYFESSNSWIYQINLGWLYIPFSNAENFWMYDADLKWLWTTSTIYPWVYVNEIKDWRYYLPQLGFYRADTQMWSSPSELVTEFSKNDSVAYTSAYYSSGTITSNNNISAWFDRSLEINGLQLFVAGAVGGQIAVPDEWAKKIAQTVKLLTDPNDEEIDIPSQERMIQVLQGASGTWHEGSPAAQRLAYGGGSDYSPNPLTDSGIEEYNGYQNLWSYMMNDMVWYRNSSDGEVNNVGDYDIAEVLEHLMHTIHLYGVPGAVTGSQNALQWDYEFHSGWQTSELYYAMKEAVDNGVFSLKDYGDENINTPDTYSVASKEYLYLLNFGMWEYGQEFWENGTLAPEWNDNARTPSGVQQNNPLGYALFNSYIKPVVSKPSLTDLRTIFQDNDGGTSGYVSD